jgi:transcriptional regulator of acetoin/glycerol metabolism
MPATAATTVPLLRESDLALIQRTLQACKGNVSGAAKQLGVSRGLIYRRLNAAARIEPTSSAAGSSVIVA